MCLGVRFDPRAGANALAELCGIPLVGIEPDTVRFCDGSLRRRCTARLVFFRELSCCDLTRFYIGLIEGEGPDRIDAELIEIVFVDDHSQTSLSGLPFWDNRVTASQE